MCINRISFVFQIRDFDWILSGIPLSLYLGVYKQLIRVWLSKSASALAQLDIEESLFKIWNYVVTLPEFDHKYASSLDILSDSFTTACKTFENLSSIITVSLLVHL